MFRPNRDNAERVNSWILVTGARAHFLKVRYTYPASRIVEGQIEFERLLIGFFAANRQ